MTSLRLPSPTTGQRHSGWTDPTLPRARPDTVRDHTRTDPTLPLGPSDAVRDHTRAENLFGRLYKKVDETEVATRRTTRLIPGADRTVI